MQHHPDEAIAAEVRADIIEGHLSTTRAVLQEVLGLSLATPNGLRVKDLARAALAATDLTNPDNTHP